MFIERLKYSCSLPSTTTSKSYLYRSDILYKNNILSFLKTFSFNQTSICVFIYFPDINTLYCDVCLLSRSCQLTGPNHNATLEYELSMYCPVGQSKLSVRNKIISLEDRIFNNFLFFPKLSFSASRCDITPLLSQPMGRDGY